MNELPKLVGGNIPPEIKSEYPQRMKEAEEELHLPVENELEKNQENLESIALISKYLMELLAEFDVPQNINIHPDRIHLLSDKDYMKQCPDDKGGALSRSWSGIFANADRLRGVSLFHALLHEFIHELSHKKYKFSQATGKAEVYRSGYAVHGYDEDEEKFYVLLEAFNEAMTEQIARYVLVQHEEEIIKKFGLSEEDMDGELEQAYVEEREQLEEVIKRIAEAKGDSLAHVWDKFVKGYFSGEMMHLRDIDRVFGEGTLRRAADVKI